MKSIRTALGPTAVVVVCLNLSQADNPPAKVDQKAPDVTGKWVGIWGPLDPKPKAAKDKAADGMPMECLVTVQGGTWSAVFEGECGRPYKYTVKMDGRQAGGSVLFKGTTDLGEKDGGVYDWIGRADDKEFVGFYTSERYTGLFRLKRAK